MADQVRLVVEFSQKDISPAMRWERSVPRSEGSVFELLGQAFEVAQRQEPQSLEKALSAFLKGALMQKQDVAEVLAAMEQPGAG